MRGYHCRQQRRRSAGRPSVRVEVMAVRHGFGEISRKSLADWLVTALMREQGERSLRNRGPKVIEGKLISTHANIQMRGQPADTARSEAPSEVGEEAPTPAGPGSRPDGAQLCSWRARRTPA